MRVSSESSIDTVRLRRLARVLADSMNSISTSLIWDGYFGKVLYVTLLIIKCDNDHIVAFGTVLYFTLLVIKLPYSKQTQENMIYLSFAGVFKSHME